LTTEYEDSERLRIVAIVQARMGSTRLPGKVLKPIAGQPLLWHIVTRLRKSRLIEDISIATTTNPRDDAIVEFCEANGITAVRGPEDDVLARFARAAEVLDADIIVRVSSDAPFVDADFIDHLVASMIEQSGDYVLLEDGAITAHEGVDPFSRRGLDRLMLDARNDAVAREHVTGYFKLHPNFVRIAKAAPYPALAKKGARLTIDTPDDLAFVEAVHARMEAKAGEASLADLLLLLEREPQLRDLNAHVQQKPIAAVGGLALIYCNGGGGFGYGHVKRMTALARALRDRNGIGVVFAMQGTADALEPIRRAGFEAVHFESHDDAALTALIAAKTPDLLVVDCREGPSREALESQKNKVPSVVVIDDGNERRLAADRAYYPPVPQVEALDWSGSTCERRVGWEWSLLGLTQTSGNARPHALRQTVLVTMGGSDPLNLTERCARALAKLDPVFRARFVIGPGMAKGVAKQIAQLSPNFETIEGATDLGIEFASADIALVAFGVTAYELAAHGVPAVYLGLTEDHALSASAFDAAGMGVALGVAADVSDVKIAQTVKKLLSDSGRRREMRASGLMTLDGQGASRVAADIAELIQAKRSKLKIAS
jgi:spore coat polysaccharide biosynthesis protein SpsF